MDSLPSFELSHVSPDFPPANRVVQGLGHGCRGQQCNDEETIGERHGRRSRNGIVPLAPGAPGAMIGDSSITSLPAI